MGRTSCCGDGSGGAGMRTRLLAVLGQGVDNALDEVVALGGGGVPGQVGYLQAENSGIESFGRAIERECMGVCVCVGGWCVGMDGPEGVVCLR